MGALLESGMVGNIGLKHLKVIKEDTLAKWDNLGFLDGLKGHVKENIAQLYENQATNLINEASSAGDSGSFETVVFPIIRRVFSKLLANDIVSVQAMNLPIGKLFYFVPKIVERGGAGVGTHTGSGTTDAPAQTSGNLYDAFYESTGNIDDGQYDYSRGKYSLVEPTLFEYTWNASGALINGTVTTATDCNRTAIFILSGFTGTGGQLTDGKGNTMDNEEFLASLDILAGQNYHCCLNPSVAGGGGAAADLAYANNAKLPFRVVTQKYGHDIVDAAGNLADGTGNIYVEVDLSCPACISCASPDGYMGSSGGTAHAMTAEYRVYDSLEFEDNMGEVSFELKGVTVSVSERKLRASWSPELAQDVSAFHNIDAEAELTALLSEEVAAEIDREILRDLRKGAAWNLRWDYNGLKRFTACQAPYTQKDWNQTLITAVNQLSAQIHKSTLRGGANWIVCSSEVSAIFDDLEYFHVSNAAADQDQYNMGIEKIGTLSGRFTVYRDPYFTANQVLIGHKGTSLLDTGYVYAPYVPLQLTPTMYNPFNFTPVKGIMTRYAKKMVNNRFYGKIQVDGVKTFDMRELR